MKSYFEQYRPFFAFLLRFFLVYVLLSVFYQSHLSTYPRFTPDVITSEVADESVTLLKWMNYRASVDRSPSEPSYLLKLEGENVARIIEGCNAVSVAILFVSFVVAFRGRTIHTILFIVGGIVVIHILNIIRIALLAAALLRFPEYEHLLHGVVFPLFIYGVVFLLWVVWVNRFSLYAGKKK
ncbi:MAG: exosortase family protein XrtF [Flavobacterium sp.]|nr:exosortase family protein XrtF [Flavobacterium sp.]